MTANAVNDFGSCQLSELDYILKKQTERTSESGKELDLLLIGACPAIVRECNGKSQSAKRAAGMRKEKNALSVSYFLCVIILFSYLSSVMATRFFSLPLGDEDFFPNPIRWAKSSNPMERWVPIFCIRDSLCFCSNFSRSLIVHSISR